MGAYHGSELPFVFATQRLIDLPWSAAEQRLSDTLSTSWLNFARTGNPNGAELSEWPAYGEGKVMELALTPRAVPLPRTDSLQFLDAHFARQRADIHPEAQRPGTASGGPAKHRH
jgi:para-nitrobenzyl esterase